MQGAGVLSAALCWITLMLLALIGLGSFDTSFAVAVEITVFLTTFN